MSQWIQRLRSTTDSAGKAYLQLELHCPIGWQFQAFEWGESDQLLIWVERGDPLPTKEQIKQVRVPYSKNPSESSLRVTVKEKEGNRELGAIEFKKD